MLDAKDARRPIKGQIQPPVGHGRGRGLTLPDTEKVRIPFGRGRLLQALGGAPPLKPAPGVAYLALRALLKGRKGAIIRGIKRVK